MPTSLLSAYLYLAMSSPQASQTSPPAAAAQTAPASAGPAAHRPVRKRVQASAARRRQFERPQVTAVAAATRAATRGPVAAGFINAVQVYPWSEGALYQLYGAPERVTDIALQPGETLIAIAAGDTVRWTVGDTSSGVGETRRTHILVKPFAPGLRTNLVITTDRRSYHLQLESTAATAMGDLLALPPRYAGRDQAGANRCTGQPRSTIAAHGRKAALRLYDHRRSAELAPDPSL